MHTFTLADTVRARDEYLQIQRVNANLPGYQREPLKGNLWSGKLAKTDNIGQLAWLVQYVTGKVE